MANIKKAHPKDRLLSLQKELDRILGELLEPSSDRYVSCKRSLEIPVDIYETANSLHIRAELPGIDKDDIKLYISRDMIMIEGKKKSAYSGKKYRFLNLEREFGAFKREIGIPKPVDGRGVKATMIAGVLLVVMPKISDRRGQRKRVQID